MRPHGEGTAAGPAKAPVRVKSRGRYAGAGGLSFRPWRGYAMPEAYTAEVDDPEAPYLAELELQVGASGDLECRAVRVSQRPGGAPVTARGLRSLPLGRLVQAAAATGALLVTPRPDGSVVMTPLLGDGAEVEGAYELSRTPAREGGRRALTDEHYREVAAIYTRAERHPTKAVHLHKAWAPIAYSTAANWVCEARRRGYLPPAETRP